MLRMSRKPSYIGVYHVMMSNICSVFGRLQLGFAAFAKLIDFAESEQFRPNVNV